MVKNNLTNFACFVSYFQQPVFLSILKFLISIVALSSSFFEIPKLPQKYWANWSTCFFTITSK